ncbi:MAG: N-acetyltransferase [Paracoccaceae bacterium]
MNLRPSISSDIPDLQAVLDETELFPSEMLPDMIGGFLSGKSDDLWITCEESGGVIGFCYVLPEQLTEGTWNMAAIAVSPKNQGQGAGRALVQEVEATLAKRGIRVLIVDTSGTDAFEQTRAFYRSNGYVEEARIRDFWADGDDKIVFWKSLTQAA